MVPARFLSVRSGICASTNFQILPPGPRAWPSGPGAAGPGQVLDKWRRFIAPRFSPGFLPVPQGPNYIPGMEVQEKVVDLLEQRPQSRPTTPSRVYTFTQDTAGSRHYTQPPHHCQLCQPCQLSPIPLFTHVLILLTTAGNNKC